MDRWKEKRDRADKQKQEKKKDEAIDEDKKARNWYDKKEWSAFRLTEKRLTFGYKRDPPPKKKK